MGVLRRLSPSFRRKSISNRNVSAVEAEVDFVMAQSPFLMAACAAKDGAADADSASASSADMPPGAAEFHRKELQLGNLLGEGFFGQVHSIIGFRLLASNRKSNNSSSSSNNNNKDEHRRISLSQAAFDEIGGAQLAVKCLTKDLAKSSSSHQFRNAAADLIVEAKYLAAMNHPNIIKLRGVAQNGAMSFCDGHDGFFLIMDRLDETLDCRIQRWKKNDDVSLATKADYALQVAHALSYLHERRIIFRDLKPNNIGFRASDPHTVQLFDFGLCRELLSPSESGGGGNGSCDDQQDNEQHEDNSMFHMSGAGSRCYMAVEIFNMKKYNLKADVYSWAFCLYEMIALYRPFDHYSFAEHKEFVAEIGMRPELCKEYNLPVALEQLIRGAWEQDPVQRLNIRQVCDKLSPIVSALKQQQQQQHGQEQLDSTSLKNILQAS